MSGESSNKPYAANMPDRIPCSKIDVGLIVYNERAILGATIDALLNAGFDSFVVLDMESTDGTTAYLGERLGSMARIVSFPRRSLIEYGFAEARNLCAMLSSREWLLFVDADEVLVSGTHHRAVMVKAHGSNRNIYGIERNNLGWDPERGGDLTRVNSLETHDRLYKPTFRMRYKGYLHEEIFVKGQPRPQESGKVALVFDHYSGLKPTVDVEQKTGLYSLMLLRAYNQIDVRQGTNSWWFDTYVPENIEAIAANAEFFARKHGYTQSFYTSGTDEEAPSGGRHDFVSALVPRPVTPDSQDEVTLDLGTTLRSLHAASVERWTGRPERAFWGEWNHPGEGSRSLTSLIEAAQSWHWDRFIKPETVAIDIGGHSGDTAIPMALFLHDRTTGRKGTVVVVEPNPAIATVLNFNLSLNAHLGHFHMLTAAVTCEDVAEIELSDHGNAECNGGVLHNENLSVELSTKLLSVAGVSYRTAGISLETLFRQIRQHTTPDPIGFIKIDCEGYDKEIIRPCRELFNIHKPVLFIEWFDWFTPADDVDLFQVIANIGYVPYDPLTLQVAEVSRRVPDLLCIHQEERSKHFP